LFGLGRSVGIRERRGGGRVFAGGDVGFGGGVGVDRGDDLADLHFGAFFHGEGDFAGGFGGAFGRDLVGFEFEERLVFFDDVAVFDVPLGKDAGADGFAHRRNFNFELGHERKS